MILLYFKQAWNLIKQEKLFSSIYIAGTGLSIAVVMVLSLVFYIKLGNIYPETNRDRLLIVKNAYEYRHPSGISNSSLSYNLVEQCLKPLKSAEAVGIIYEPDNNNFMIFHPETKQYIPTITKYTDDEFWTVFPFQFIDGKAFSQQDIQSGIKTAVIAESLALKLFGEKNVTGKDINMNFQTFRICGVVKDASFATPTTYAQLWLPYSVDLQYKKIFGKGGGLGNFQAYILSPNRKEMDKVREEAINNFDRFSNSLENFEFTTKGQPDKLWQSMFREMMGQEINFNKIIIQFGLIFFILLLIPAISLAGMTDSRMERRLMELGVRRAFGSPRKTLMLQIISENMLFTLLGGMLGLLFAYILILLFKDWMLSILEFNQSWTEVRPREADLFVTPSMLINIPVFIIALGICFILNLLSSFIPAWKASRKEITYSLNA